MAPTYNSLMVILSLAVAFLAAYTTLALTGRISTLIEPWRRRYWLAGSAIAMGTGVWSMHFVGMLAMRLPIAVGYSFELTAASLAMVVVVSYLGLSTASRPRAAPWAILGSGVIMGLGIAAMHYTGMAAMHMSPAPIYNVPWLVASIVIAVVASIVALGVAFRLRRASDHISSKRLIAAAVLGLAITGMHYAGMQAVSFLPGTVCGAVNDISNNLLAAVVVGFTLIILAIALLLSILDSRFESHTNNLSMSLSNANRQLLRLATRDQLTDLPNRTTFTEALNASIRLAARTNRKFAVLFMDLDGFKTVNDSLGHAVGDGLLKAFAARLQSSVRTGDMVARLGGDEFVVLLEDLKNGHDAASICTTILANLEADLTIENNALRVTASIGVALYPQDGVTVDLLLKNADAAMYDAKQAGRGTFRYFEAHMADSALHALRLQRGLRDAVANGEMELYFQPKFSGVGQQLSGAEALIRWNHPELGLLGPAEFIPLAERSGQIIQIGYWVVKETCRHINQWDRSELPAMKVAINLSPLQLWQADLVATIQAIVDDAGVAPNRIMFEITETVAMQDADRTTAAIRQFHLHGFEIAIDDFGTGYSSLAYLQQFRVKQLKIDRFFTDGLDKYGDEAYAIVSAIIALAHSLKMDVVAEGVETLSQLNKLNSLMCDQVQGFYLSKPLPAGDFMSFLRDNPTPHPTPNPASPTQGLPLLVQVNAAAGADALTAPDETAARVAALAKAALLRA